MGLRSIIPIKASMTSSCPPPTVAIRTVRAQMATNYQSSKFRLAHRGGTLRFGLHKPTGQYRKKHKGKNLYLGSDPKGVLSQWLAKTTQHDEELINRPLEN